MSGVRQNRISKNLHLRATILDAIRTFFNSRDFIEIETPLRVPAPAPEPHINPPTSGDMYLQSSPELYMKRLLAAGYPKIFQICKCFRNDERGNRHLPEFTMLEWYETGADYTDLMDRCEQLIRFVCEKAGKDDLISYQGQPLEIKDNWEKITVHDAFAAHASVDMTTALDTDSFDEMIAFEIEPRFKKKNRPVFLYDYPAAKAALAALKADNTAYAERFELYMGGLELCNGFTELTDPAIQRRRFEEEIDFRKQHHRRVTPMPEKFLNAMVHMPPCAGNALGIDRLIMILADTDCIDDVVAFTTEEL